MKAFVPIHPKILDNKTYPSLELEYLVLRRVSMIMILILSITKSLYPILSVT